MMPQLLQRRGSQERAPARYNTCYPGETKYHFTFHILYPQCKRHLLTWAYNCKNNSLLVMILLFSHCVQVTEGNHSSVAEYVHSYTSELMCQPVLDSWRKKLLWNCFTSLEVIIYSKTRHTYMKPSRDTYSCGIFWRNVSNSNIMNSCASCCWPHCSLGWIAKEFSCT